MKSQNGDWECTSCGHKESNPDAPRVFLVCSECPERVGPAHGIPDANKLAFEAGWSLCFSDCTDDIKLADGGNRYGERPDLPARWVKRALCPKCFKEGKV